MGLPLVFTDNGFLFQGDLTGDGVVGGLEAEAEADFGGLRLDRGGDGGLGEVAEFRGLERIGSGGQAVDAELARRVRFGSASGANDVDDRAWHGVERGGVRNLARDDAFSGFERDARHLSGSLGGKRSLDRYAIGWSEERG